MLANHIDQGVRDGKVPDAAPGLGLGEPCLSSIQMSPVDRPAHTQNLVIQVNVTDLQAAEFPASQPAGKRGEKHRQPRVIRHVLGQHAQLLGSDRRYVLPYGIRFRRYRKDERIVLKQWRGPIHAHGCGRAEHGLEPHAGPSERPLPLGMRAVIPAFDMSGLDFRQAQPFERGHEMGDVQVQVASGSSGYPFAVGQRVFGGPLLDILLEHHLVGSFPPHAVTGMNPRLDAFGM